MGQAVYCESCRQVFTTELDTERRAPCPRCDQIVYPPDVFISYSTPDLLRAQELATILRREKVTPWLAPEDRISVGNWFVTALTGALREVKVLILVLSNYSIESVHVRRELQMAVDRNLPILPLMIRKCALDDEFKYLLGLHQWHPCLEESFEAQADFVLRHVKMKLRESRLAVPKETATGLVDTDATLPKGITRNDVCPYVGPTPVPRKWGQGFYGRDPEVEQLLGLIKDARIVLLYASSGAGKSSLLNAEIAPRLENTNYDVLPGSGSTGIRVGGAVDDKIKFGKDLLNIFAYSAILCMPGNKPSLGQKMVECLRVLDRNAKHRRMIIFDQFEELFTQHSERYEDRGAFIDQVVEALRADPTLHVLFAIRKEYLSDMVDLASRHLPPEFPMKQFALPRIGADGALDAITRPITRYARYAPGVAEEIAKQLRTIKVTGPDNKLKPLPGEHIELVHLQIVCWLLWDYLAKKFPGTKQIELRHLEDFCGEGQSLEDFVPNALNAFYQEAIERVCADERGQKAVQFGLMKFITRASTRTMVLRGDNKTGRLSNATVDALEREHLLRFEKRGEQLWYELSHDSIAEPVAKQRDIDPELSKLLFASDLLEKMIEKAKAESGGKLHDYFGNHGEVLSECKRFQSTTYSLLEPEEMEFIFRASLRTGHDLAEWAQQLERYQSELYGAVLRNAVSFQTPGDPAVAVGIRGNAALLLGQSGTNNKQYLHQELLELALHDEEESVQQTAAVSLARLDMPELYTKLFNALRDGNAGRKAVKALARIRIVADNSSHRTKFEDTYLQLASSERRRIATEARRIRRREGIPELLFAFLPAALFASLTAAPFKSVFGGAGWALTQHVESFGMGLFHGFVAGVIWAGLITLGITYYHVVHGRMRGLKSAVKPVGALCYGALSGLFGSVLITSVILSIYGVVNLEGMGWLVSRRKGIEEAAFRWTDPFIEDVFVRTKFGWVHLVTGMGLGVGMAMMTNSIRASKTWTKFVDAQKTIDSFTEAKRVTWEIMKIASPKVCWLLVPISLTAILASMIPEITAMTGRASFAGLVKGLVGDCLTQAFGAYFGIVGMFLGLVALQYGFRVDPRAK